MYNQVYNKFIFEEDKALNTLLYILQKVDNLYNIMKVFYFADKNHLSKYGRFIFGETYCAMEKGQVPSNIYDMIKFVRGDGQRKFDEEIKQYFHIENRNKVKGDKAPDLEFLSKSDIECLDEAIREYGKTYHKSLFSKSHKDSAYNNTPLHQTITLDRIIDSLPNKDEVRNYLQNIYN